MPRAWASARTWSWVGPTSAAALGHVAVAEVEVEHAAAHAVACLEDHHRLARGGDVAGRRQPGKARADHDDVDRRRAADLLRLLLLVVWLVPAVLARIGRRGHGHPDSCHDARTEEPPPGAVPAHVAS